MRSASSSTAWLSPRDRLNGDQNKLFPEDRPVHDWYRFVLSFPPHLVRDYLRRFDLDRRGRVLDPFCGTGTTLVECKKLGVASVGIEANPMAHLASTVKTDWSVDPDRLAESAMEIAEVAINQLEADGILDNPPLWNCCQPQVPLRTLEPEAMELLLTSSISPLPLHKVLVLLERMSRHEDEPCFRHQQVALARELITSIGNLSFGPEVGVATAKPDAPVISAWLARVQSMANDLRKLRGSGGAPAEVRWGDSRQLLQILEPASVDGVITSPPYPNEKDYTRTTRLESVLLGLIRSKPELRALKHHLVRSNTRSVYTADDDDRRVAHNQDVQQIAEEIETRRIALGKTSGFERLYGRVTKLYFGGMARHLDELRTILRPGAQLAYVVGDQASYLRVMIRTGQILGEIARELGYELVGIDLFRTRRSSATNEELREEVVLLRWPG